MTDPEARSGVWGPGPACLVLRLGGRVVLMLQSSHLAWSLRWHHQPEPPASTLMMFSESLQCVENHACMWGTLHGIGCGPVLFPKVWSSEPHCLGMVIGAHEKYSVREENTETLSVSILHPSIHLSPVSFFYLSVYSLQGMYEPLPCALGISKKGV